MSQSKEALFIALDEVAEWLPQQAPLHAFVHHNTLHALEHLAFEDAVEVAADKLGAEAYPSEVSLQGATLWGGIAADSLQAVCNKEASSESSDAVGKMSYEQFLCERLLTHVEVPGSEMLQWLKSEERLYEQFQAGLSPGRQQMLVDASLKLSARATEERGPLLERLWSALEPGVGPVDEEERVRKAESDSSWAHEDLVVPMMMRLSAAFLDQGIAYWPMPQRDDGFWRCFVALYSQKVGPPESWLRELKSTLREESQLQGSSWQACLWALDALKIPQEQWQEALHRRLLALRGWAGMFSFLEHNPKKAPFRILSVHLCDFVSVLLLLEVCARAFTGLKVEAIAHSSQSSETIRHSLATSDRSDLQFEAFALAQKLNVDPLLLLDPVHAATWLKWTLSVTSLKRRKLLLRALESESLASVCADLQNHNLWLAHQSSPAPLFQCVFCIDDREESFRRHLEEVDPHVETYSYPGFFGVAMRFRGLGEFRARDLCPVNVPSTHRIVEGTPQAAPSALGAARSHASTESLVRGFVASLLGLVALIPLVLGVLFPRWFRLAKESEDKRVGSLNVRAQGSGVNEEQVDNPALREGYTTEEMVNVVEKLLREIGLIENFSQIVFLIGHGSSSINNPHLAAYGCGATAGGCGGPNARVFAEMANDKLVRGALKTRGIYLPESTFFVGGMHNTCTDDVSLYRPVKLTLAADAVIKRAELSFGSAAENNAHERCRLFDGTPQELSPSDAKRIVEVRAVDLSEARPEYNHARNSLCIVGQRKSTRGLFLDQRAFLVSYDPTTDSEMGDRLAEVLLGSLPVGMGINLEYFFGAIDQRFYGAGSKLPHNVTGLLGVMDGHKSDLRTGLYNQMIEKHVPARLIAIVECSVARLRRVLEAHSQLEKLVKNGWFQLVAWNPSERSFHVYQRGAFVSYKPPARPPFEAQCSADFYKSTELPLRGAHISAGFEEQVA